MTQMILGGVPVSIYSGEPLVSYADAGGSTDVILSGGRPVRMTHFSKRVITVTGSGWISSGLDGVNLRGELDFWSPKPLTLATVSTTATLTAAVRPDEPVTAEALVGEQWVRAEVTMSDLDATITPVAGALVYRLVWFPRFTVLVDPPAEDIGDRQFSWQLVMREV
jgi:hypothetical protein